MATWEMSKENIQPLRQGRRVSSIEEHDQKKILKEQQWVAISSFWSIRKMPQFD